jgi:hypothetical protein
MRHLFLLLLFSAAACATTAPAGARPDHLRAEEAASAEAAPEEREKVVVTGTIEAVAADVDALVRAVRDRVREAGGRVMNEEVTGLARDGTRALMRLRLPPPQVAPFADWLTTASEVRSRNLSSEEVSEAYRDRALAIHNLRATMTRLEALVAGGGNLSEVLTIEREITRVRGEIEQLEGAQRHLAARAAMATVDLQLAPAEAARAPRALFDLVPSATVLVFTDQRPRHDVRPGAGLTLMFTRQAGLELQLFPTRGSDPRSVLATLQGTVFSDFLGGGRRPFLNPYLGLLAGGGSVNGHGAFTTGGLVGVELYRAAHLLVDLRARGQVLLYGQGERPADLVLQAGLGVGVPF